MKSLYLFVFLTGAALTLLRPVAAQEFSVTQLPGTPYGINNLGQVAGYNFQTNAGYVWSRDGAQQDLPGPSYAFAINDAGQVAGTNDTHAIRWSAASGMEDLGTLGHYSTGLAINSAGNVVGLSYLPDGSKYHAFLWTPVGGMQDLGTLGGDLSTATGINDLGQVVGYSNTVDNISVHAFLWTPAGGIVDMGTISQGGESDSGAHALNNAGQVAGFSTNFVVNGRSMEAFRWTEIGGFQDIGPMDSNFGASANAINAAGQVVGELDRFKPHRRHAFVWTQAIGMRDLDAMVLSKYGKFETAVGINSWGEIIAYGIPLNLFLTPILHTTLVSSPNPSIVGQSVTFTAQVGSTTQGPPPDGELVTFKTGLKVLGVMPLAGGVATLKTSVLKAGTHTVKAAYAGDAHYAGSISKGVMQIVQP